MIYPKFSIIIPALEKKKYKKVLESIGHADYPAAKIEIILALGKAPSLQRNLAIKKAKGEIILFLDDDSLVSAQIFKEIIKGFNFRANSQTTFSYTNNFFINLSLKVNDLIFNNGFLSNSKFNFTNKILNRIFINSKNKLAKKKPGFCHNDRVKETIMVGGPNVLPLSGNGFWQEVADVFLQSTFAHWKMASRYRPLGCLRYASEKELILCNLAVKSKIFKKKVKFNELLYPNEENELLQKLLKEEKGVFVYNPKAVVSRLRRDSLIKIARQFFFYGKGRMEQIRNIGLKDNFIFFLPLLFLIYFLFIPFFLMGRFYWFITPLLIYLFITFISTLGFYLRKKRKIFFIVLPLTFLFIHFSYALGFLLGLFTSFNKKRDKIKDLKKMIKIQVVKNFG